MTTEQWDLTSNEWLVGKLKYETLPFLLITEIAKQHLQIQWVLRMPSKSQRYEVTDCWKLTDQWLTTEQCFYLQM